MVLNKPHELAPLNASATINAPVPVLDFWKHERSQGLLVNLPAHRIAAPPKDVRGLLHCVHFSGCKESVAAVHTNNSVRIETIAVGGFGC